MNWKRIGKWGRRVVWGTLGLIFTFGCSPLSTIAFLSPQPPSPAAYPLSLKEGSKKKEVVVALFVSSAPGLGPTLAGSDGKLASDMAKKFPAMAKESKLTLVVIDPVQINKFKMNNQSWKLMNPCEWGKKLGADYVIDVRLDKMSFYQPGSLDQLYEGHADVAVDVYEVAAGPGEPKYTYVHPFSYPRTGVIDATSMPVSRFKQDFLEHLATDLVMKHIPYKQGLGVAD